MISNIPRSFHKIIGGFLSRNLQARREWDHIFKLLKEKTVNQEYCIWHNCPLKMKEKQDFPDKQKLRDFIIIRSALQELLNELLQSEGKRYLMEIHIHRQHGRTLLWFKRLYVMGPFRCSDLSRKTFSCIHRLAQCFFCFYFFQILPNPYWILKSI